MRPVIATHTAYVLVAAITSVLLLVCVLFHYESLSVLSRVLLKLPHWHRRRILLLIFSVLALHVAEIWIFGAGYYWLLGQPETGALIAAAPLSFLDHVYFSAVVYTTLGLGDITPMGAIRFMTGTEALLGFVMVTWSASFTYLEMQRFWRNN